LTTSIVPDGDGGIEVEFDFVDHVAISHCANRTSQTIRPELMSVAEFHRKFVDALGDLGGDATLHANPNELPEATPFAADTTSRSYDAHAVARFSGRRAPLHRGGIPNLPDDVTQVSLLPRSVIRRILGRMSSLILQQS